MKALFTICNRIIFRSVRQSRVNGTNLQQCFCTTMSNDDQSENPLKQSVKQLQDLLDGASQGLGPFDEMTEEDQWRTSPYPNSAVISPRQSQSARSLRPNISPSDTSIILFPGYGSQYVGMGRELMKFPKARDIFDASSAILKMDVRKMLFNGPKHELNRIKYADPLIFICSLAALEKLKEERPWAIENCMATAGFSVGEITALTFAGVFTFSDGLKLVRARAEAIEYASEMERGGMAVVHYNAGSKLKEAIVKAKEWCNDRGINDPECVVATYLNSNMKIIAGHTEALKYIDCNKRFFKLDAVFEHPARGAYHSKLMMPVAEKMKKKLKDFEIMEPAIAVHSNVDGGYYKNVNQIQLFLIKQIYKPIKWEQMLHILYERDPTCPFPETIICGPLNQLGEYLKQALSYINSHLSEFKLKRMFPIEAPGAVHTKLMNPAVDVLRKLLTTIELSEPSTHVHSNVTGKRYTNLSNIQKILPQQICKPLLWEQLVHKLFDRDPDVDQPSVFTCGPRSIDLKKSLSKINMEASRNCIFVF